MKYLPLLWKSLWRKKIRTLFTIGSLFVAFLLFGVLMAIRTAFTFGVEIAGAAVEGGGELADALVEHRGDAADGGFELLGRSAGTPRRRRLM